MGPQLWEDLVSDTGIEAAKAQAVRYGAEQGINPFMALLSEVRRAAGHVAWLGVKVAEAPTDEALLDEWGPWLRLYQKERAALLKASETAVRLGLAERVVKVEERRAELVARVLLATLEALDLPPEIRDRAPAVLRDQLLALDVESADVSPGG
jgi:hypothetical protein